MKVRRSISAAMRTTWSSAFARIRRRDLSGSRRRWKSAFLRARASRSMGAPAIWTLTTLRVRCAITSDNAGVRLKNIGGAARVELSRSDVVHMSGVKGDVEIKGHGSDIELEDIGRTRQCRWHV